MGNLELSSHIGTFEYFVDVEWLLVAVNMDCLRQ